MSDAKGKNYLNEKITISSWLLTLAQKRRALLYLGMLFVFIAQISIAQNDVNLPGAINKKGMTAVETGERLFSELGCVTCHGNNDAALGANLGDIFGKEVTFTDGTTVVRDDDYLRESILNPQARIVARYAPIMPTFKGSVNDEQLGQLIAYIKSLSSRN